MGYSDPLQVEQVLNQALTSSSTSSTSAGSIAPGKLTAIGRKIDPNRLPEKDVLYYIQMADAHINAALSQQYVTPLLETTDMEMSLLVDINEYNSTLLLDKAFILMPGEVLVLTDGTNEERHLINEVVDHETVTLVTDIMHLYQAENTRVLRVKYPDPIPYLSAKLAAAALFKKYFMAQVEPGKSEYGELMRKEAIEELNNIREGRTILHGVRRIGWRFANPTLLERYNLKGSWDQDGTRTDSPS